MFSNQILKEDQPVSIQVSPGNFQTINLNNSIEQEDNLRGFEMMVNVQ
jgi:hypothetical protein